MENNTVKETSGLIETTNTITASFGRLKFVALAAIVGMAVTAIACVAYVISKTEAMHRQVFVIDNGQVLTASGQDRSISLRDRIEFQATNIHKLLFTVTPNKEVVQQNIEEALQISDRSVYNYYVDLNEKKFYSRMYQNNASQDVRIDSVKVDISRQPYRVATFATLDIIRESNITRYNLVTRCTMIEVNMNRKNREGLQVENFEVVRNEKQETRARR